MSDEVKSKKCLYCGNYEGYYTKGLCHFESIKKGRCQIRDQIVKTISVVKIGDQVFAELISEKESLRELYMKF